LKINFFDRESVIQSFSKLYNIEESTLVALCHIANRQKEPTNYFMRICPVGLDEIDISNLELHCKHITTQIDDCESLRRYGLLTLQKALEFDTPLKCFLQERGIVFNIETRKVAYKGKDVWLVEADEECKECFYGTDCQYEKSIFSDNATLVYRNDVCPYRDAIKKLRTTIYYDEGEIEVHLLGGFEPVHNYSQVKYFPEILETLEDMINELFDEKVTLSEDWRALTGGKYYCLEFDANIKKFEFITTGPYYEPSWYSDFFQYCSTECYSLSDVNNNFYGNLYLLSTGIPVICGETPERYGQLLVDTEIPIERINIEEYSV